jgi:hypothetical protein
MNVLWHRVVNLPETVEGLGILCAAREALSLDALAMVANWNAAEHDGFRRSAAFFLTDEPAEPAYRSSSIDAAIERGDSTTQFIAYRIRHEWVKLMLAENSARPSSGVAMNC